MYYTRTVIIIWGTLKFLKVLNIFIWRSTKLQMRKTLKCLLPFHNITYGFLSTVPGEAVFPDDWQNDCRDALINLYIHIKVFRENECTQNVIFNHG